MNATRACSILASLLLVAGCSCDDTSGVDGGPNGDGGGSDGGTGMDGATADGATTDGGGGMDATVIILPDGAVLLPDGMVIGGGPITCQGHLYQCGDTIDNDGDGLADDADPDCLGPCDNNEGGLWLAIPGGDSAPCSLDCYFDQDQGGGNDHCAWDHRCDPLEPDPNRLCMYRDPPPPSAQCPDPQDPRCETVCGPLVPNGCDCFGCCNLPAGGDRWVFIGSVDGDGNPTCTLDEASNDAACHPCTPVANCLNPCGACELCLGRTELPPECLPPPPVDAGTLPDGGPAPSPDSGTPPPTCMDGRQSCGVPGADPCPAGYFCLTGCCTYFG